MKLDGTKKRFIIIPSVAVCGFSLFLQFTYIINSDNAERLRMIQDTYFPIFEIASTCAARLDRITELLSSGASTGEIELIYSAREQALIMLERIKLLRKLEPQRKQDIDELNEAFKAYYQNAETLSLQVVRNELTLGNLPGQKETQNMQQQLEQTQRALNEFRKYSYDNFLTTIEEANRSSAIGLRLGAIVGITTVVIIVVTSVSIGATIRD